MKKSKTIEIPKSWGAISLKTYLALQKELKNYEDNEDAQIAVLFYHLCGINGEELRALSAGSYSEIKNILLSFLSQQEHELQRIIKIGDIEYGFEPNLSEMSYGAYCDITKFNELAIDKNWAKIMSILYRPINKKFLNTYSIQPYEGKIDESLFLELTMDIHFGAYFFFVLLSRDLLNSTLNSMTKMEDIPHSIKQILVKSGELMRV